MKTTPLPEILKQITPLPYRVAIAPPQFKRKMNIETRLGDCIALVNEGSFWDIGEHSASQGGNRAETQALYLTHAANVLPGLVEAAGDIIAHLDTPQSARLTNMADLLEDLRKALSIATNVPVNS